MAEADKTIKCRDCKEPFLFSAGEQAFYTQKEFSDPIRCRDCREKKKLQRANEAKEGKYD